MEDFNEKADEIAIAVITDEEDIETFAQLIISRERSSAPSTTDMVEPTHLADFGDVQYLLWVPVQGRASFQDTEENDIVFAFSEDETQISKSMLFE